MHPFLDVKNLSDEDIIDRLGKAYSYLNNQVSLGHTPTVKSIEEIIQALEDERRNRMQRMVDEEYKKKNPDLNKTIDLGGLEK